MRGIPGTFVAFSILTLLLLPAGLPGQQRSEACTSDDCCRALEGAELHGRVLSSETDRALSGATIEFRVTSPPESGNAATTQRETDRSGSYRFCGIPTPARIEARAERSGATSRSVSFQLDVPRRVELSFEIRGLPAKLDSLEAAAAVAAANAEPGRVVGRIEDAETGRPVAEATLTLEPSGRQALTDGQGRFTISEAPSGKGTLAIHHLAYGDQTVDVDVPSGLTVDLDIELPPKAIEVAPIDVTVEATIRDPFLERRGFYDRLERDFGHFWTPEELERRNPLRVTHVLQQTPGVKIARNCSSGRCVRIPYMASSAPQPTGGFSRSTSTDGDVVVTDTRGFSVCAAQIYVDGVKVGGAPDAFVHAQDLAAIEVYRGAAGMAPEFIDSSSRCGVIVLWTKRGPRLDSGGQP